MSAPVPLPVSASDGWWSGFTISGVTGGGAAGANKAYNRAGPSNDTHEYSYITPIPPDYPSNQIFFPITISRSLGYWAMLSGIVPVMKDTSNAVHPWEGTWTSLSASYTGTPVFTRTKTVCESMRSLSPTIIAATLTTADENENSFSDLTAKAAGRVGNSIRYQQIKPSGNNVAASVVVNGLDITVNLATGSGGAITTTGAQRNALIAGNAAAAALITAANSSGSDGTGLCTAYGFSSLSGGAGGLAPAPQPITVH